MTTSEPADGDATAAAHTKSPVLFKEDGDLTTRVSRSVVGLLNAMLMFWCAQFEEVLTVIFRKYATLSSSMKGSSDGDNTETFKDAALKDLCLKTDDLYVARSHVSKEHMLTASFVQSQIHNANERRPFDM